MKGRFTTATKVTNVSSLAKLHISLTLKIHCIPGFTPEKTEGAKAKQIVQETYLLKFSNAWFDGFK